MLVKVLKPFPYHVDPRTVLELRAGDQCDVADDVVEGLIEEGFVGEPDEVRAPAVEIPADWRDLHWFKIQALAKRLTGDAVGTKAAATAVVEAELALRNG